MKFLFDALLYQPIFNLFVLVYHLIPDVGVVIVIMTVMLKAVLYPFTAASLKAQKSLADLQTQVDQIKKKYPNDKDRVNREMLELYRVNKVNPLGSCLPLIIQLFISIALYYVLRAGLTSDDFTKLYSFVPNPGHINTVSLGWLDLSQSRNIVLALLAGASQFWVSRMMVRKRPPAAVGPGGKDEDMMAMVNKQMLYFVPVITVFAGLQFPAGLALYWFFSTLLTGFQQLVLFREKPHTQKEV